MYSSELKDTVDWRRITIFHTWIKIGNKKCKIIVDSGSCINIVIQFDFEDMVKNGPTLAYTELLRLTRIDGGE